MTFEISLPEEWPPGLALAVAQMIRQSLREGFPIIIPVRKDITPEQISGAFDRVRAIMAEAGLAA
jgi:hypothetical protein